MTKDLIKEKNEMVIVIEIGDRVYTEVIEGNLELSKLTPDEAKYAINRAVGKFAFYGALRADAKRMQSKVHAAFESWQAAKYREIDTNPDSVKKTEKWKSNYVMINNQAEWDKWKQRIRRTDCVVDKLTVLIQAFEMMSRTLQSVMSMMRTEMDMQQSC